jgi:hypothetical protein
VVQVIHEESGEVLYTLRLPRPVFKPPVFASGKYTVRIGRDRPDLVRHAAIEAKEQTDARLEITL